MGRAMNKMPGSFFVFDPGRTCGFSYCLSGGDKHRSGTWRFKQEAHGAAYAEFASNLKNILKSLPDPQVGMEMATLVGHGEDNRLDPKQVIFSAGWPAIAMTICHSLCLREPIMIPIQTWRSRTHRKVQVPKDMKGAPQAQRSKWFKLQAKLYCDKQGWKYETEDEAEANCMLEALRLEFEPDLAFDKGASSYHQESFL